MALPPFDPDKERRNVARHDGLSLTRSAELTGGYVIYSPRRGEDRWVRFGLLDGVLHASVFTIRDGAERYISLRRASRRERKDYLAHAKTNP